MEGKLGRVCGWCGKAPKSIFQLSYHLELFSRAMALTHTHIGTPARVPPKSRLQFILFLILMFSFTASGEEEAER